MKTDDLIKIEKFFKSNLIGFKNRACLGHICHNLNLSNRTVRKGIEILHAMKVPVVSDMKYKGYFYADKNSKKDMESVKRFVKSQRNRIYKIWKSIKCFDDFFPEGQQELDFGILKKIDVFMEKIKRWYNK